MLNRPLAINWMISGRCNLCCKFCYARFSLKQLNYSKKFEILTKIINSQVPKIVFGGGEPLLDKDLCGLLEVAKKHHVFATVHTNGILLSEGLLGQIGNLAGRISLALDGSSNIINEKMRGVPGFFDKTMSNLKRIKAIGLDFSLKTVVAKQNIDDLPRLAEKIQKIQPTVWLLTEFQPLRRGLRYKKEYELSAGEFDTVRSKFRGLGVNISFRSKNDLSQFPHFFIDSIGDVYTNGYLKDVYVGSAFKTEISALWEKIVLRNKVTQKYWLQTRTDLRGNV